MREVDDNSCALIFFIYKLYNYKTIIIDFEKVINFEVYVKGLLFC